MKTIIIYKSISGFTEKYAKWIAEELKADIIKQRKATKKLLEKYDTIIYGGALHAVGVNGLNKIKKIIDKLKNKNFIVFATGASPYKEGIEEQIKKNNFDKDIQLYYFRGGFNFKKLDLKNKIIMFLFVNMLKTKKQKSKDERGMIEAYEKPVDFTTKDNIKDLVKYVKKLQCP